MWITMCADVLGQGGGVLGPGRAGAERAGAGRGGAGGTGRDRGLADSPA